MLSLRPTVEKAEELLKRGYVARGAYSEYFYSEQTDGVYFFGTVGRITSGHTLETLARYIANGAATLTGETYEQLKERYERNRADTRGNRGYLQGR